MKVFRIVISGEEHPHYTITNAFKKKFELVDTLYWEEFTDLRYMNEVVQARVKAIKYDMVFLQVQSAGIITVETARILSENVQYVLNWTGDVRNDIEWFKELSPYVITLFTNTHNVDEIKSIGGRADYLQTGYDHKYYFNQKINRLNNIAFCGNYYDKFQFPLTEERVEAVRLLKTAYPENFNLYGAHWEKLFLKSEGIANNEYEALLYNNTSLALSISHFNYGRYFSDRLLRELACGCCVLSHRFVDCELEFTDGKHIVYFDNHEDLLQKISYYFKNPDEARKIGDEASKYVAEKYNWESVLDNLIDLLKKY